MSESDKRSLFTVAKLSERIDRFDEMMESMKSIVKIGEPLTTVERNMLSTAYKGKITNLRSCWRALTEMEIRLKDMGEKAEAQKFRQKIELELKECCNELLDLVDRYLLPKASDNLTKVYYIKLKGDFNRYLAEILMDDIGEERNNAIEKTLTCYKSADELAEQLPTTDPIRLGLALNFSVFYFDILQDKGKASKKIEQTLENIRDKKSLPDECLQIIKLLIENLGNWTHNEVDGNQSDDEGDSESGE